MSGLVDDVCELRTKDCCFHQFSEMNRRNPNQNNPNDFLSAAFAGVAIGAIGYGVYKLFGGSNETNHANKRESKPASIRFRMNSQHSFPSDSKTYLVNTDEECRYAMRELKS